jgi:hypothetical protein
MKWVRLGNNGEHDVFGRIDDDGLMRVTCISPHPEFVAWLAEGNTPEEWNTDANI